MQRRCSWIIYRDMAQKRMFDRAITETDQFTDMPMSSKALYFLLGMDADDDGFVSAKRVMKLHGAQEDDLNILLAKNYAIKFASGVVVITHWHKNNYLDQRRIRKTEYTNEKKMLVLRDGNYQFAAPLSVRLASAKRPLSVRLASIEECRIEENRIEEFSVEKNAFFNKNTDPKNAESIHEEESPIESRFSASKVRENLEARGILPARLSGG